MNSLAHPSATTAASRWHASLALRFRRTERGCRMVESRHVGPLAVQRAFYPEGKDLAHIYLLHPPGGLVSGDRLDVALTLEDGARVLCTTPGAGRVYRARPDRTLQEQYNTLTLAPGAALEWFPQELIVYPDARAKMDTRIDLADGAYFAGWDIAVLGLPASGQLFTTGELQQRFLLTHANKPVLSERLMLNMADASLFHAKAGLQSFAVNGLFIAGPYSEAQLAQLPHDALQQHALQDVNAQSRIGRLGQFMVGRYLGNCAQQARRCFLAWWAILRPILLDRPLCLPAIWST